MLDRVGQICTLPSRILVATDLTDIKQILPVAIDYALESKAALKLLHVLPGVSRPDWNPDLHGRRDRSTAKVFSERILEDAATQASQDGAKCTWVTRSGQVAEAVSQMVRQWKSDWVIVGSHGIKKLRQELLGSVAESIFHEVDVPVLAIGTEVAPDRKLPNRKCRILFAAALTRESQAVTDFVLRFAEMYRAELTMLHVVPEVVKAHPSSLRVQAYAEGMFNQILSGIGIKKPRPSYMIERGQVVETILRVASDDHFDLIILGGVSGSSFRTDIMPGVSYRVICGAQCPVLLLKEESHRIIRGRMEEQVRLTSEKVSQSGLPITSRS
ncbi:MAG: universal stress protein [Edaphobacter sp.]